MPDGLTLDDLLSSLVGDERTEYATDEVEAVGANLARHFDALVEPALDKLGNSLLWKHRAALAYALGHVDRTPARAAALDALSLDPHPEVSTFALAAQPRELSPELREAMRTLLARGTACHAQVVALASRGARVEDEALFIETARARATEIATVALEALGRLEGISADGLAVVVESVLPLDRRAAAVGAVGSLGMRIGIERMRELLASRPAAMALLQRAVERSELQATPTLLALAGKTAPTTTPQASASPKSDLASFGTVLDGTRREHAIRVGDPAIVDEVARLLTAPQRRSVVLVGPHGAGKTNLVHAVARKLAAQSPSWSVLETATGEVLAGTKFLGEWETRLRKLVDAAKAPARVIVYFADVHALAAQGRSADRDGSFADILAPYLDRGELAILGESTEAALERGTNRHEAMRRLFERVRVAPLTASGAAEVVRGRLAHAGENDRVTYAASPAVVDQIVDAGALYAPGAAHPAGASRLTDLIVELERERVDAGPERTIESSDVVAALARSTGMPATLLDDRAPFDRAEVRAFFEERVLGQPEAVDVVVELVTLIKAGLTDPDRPYGSLFFVGPTGVGKTEIAKALAEYLYGTPERMVRVDMSELREWDSYERLVGSLRNTAVEGVLVRRVAEQPFSVVLLDEIEKAHPNVHDVLLQLLDDGRLTDPRGRTTDFRRTVVVMTSNIGSKIEMDALGFDARAGEAPSEDKVLREVRRVFRPELVNRFGRVVVFRPLSEATMRTLVRRELGNVVMRSGVLRRRLVVDLAPDLVDLLMREGFSVAYGARPLKRRVERRVLLPIAERIVALGPEAGGTILRAEAEGDRVVVRAIAPPTSEPVTAPVARAAPTIASAEARLATARERAAALVEHARRHETHRRRSELLARTLKRTFWDDAARARLELAELAELDDRIASLESLERRVEGLGDLLADHVRRGQKVAPEAHHALDEIERALALLEHRLLVDDPSDRADVILTLASLGASAEDARLLDTLVAVYEGWARAHDATLTWLDQPVSSESPRAVTMHLEGHGLYGLFRGESGLHRLAETGRGKDRRSVVARVTVLPCPDAPLEGTTTVRGARRGRTRFSIADASGTTSFEVELPRDRVTPGVERLLECWLRARVESKPAARDALVRRYGVEEKYAADEDSGQRFRTKELATTGLDAIFEARLAKKLEEKRLEASRSRSSSSS